MGIAFSRNKNTLKIYFPIIKVIQRRLYKQRPRTWGFKSGSLGSNPAAATY